MIGTDDRYFTLVYLPVGRYIGLSGAGIAERVSALDCRSRRYATIITLRVRTPACAHTKKWVRIPGLRP